MGSQEDQAGALSAQPAAAHELGVRAKLPRAIRGPLIAYACAAPICVIATYLWLPHGILTDYGKVVLGLGFIPPYLVLRRVLFIRFLTPHRGFICPDCHTPLRGFPDHGVCPGCNAAYTRAEIISIWRDTSRLALKFSSVGQTADVTPSRVTGPIAPPATEWTVPAPARCPRGHAVQTADILCGRIVCPHCGSELADSGPALD